MCVAVSVRYLPVVAIAVEVCKVIVALAVLGLILSCACGLTFAVDGGFLGYLPCVLQTFGE